MQNVGMNKSSICLPKMNNSTSAVAAVWHCWHHSSGERQGSDRYSYGEIISLKG